MSGEGTGARGGKGEANKWYKYRKETRERCSRGKLNDTLRDYHSFVCIVPECWRVRGGGRVGEGERERGA